MCGIVGYLDRHPGHAHPVGRVLLSMLQALSCRGPDSAGVAAFAPPRSCWVLQVKLPDPAGSAGDQSAGPGEVEADASGHVYLVICVVSQADSQKLTLSANSTSWAAFRTSRDA